MTEAIDNGKMAIDPISGFPYFTGSFGGPFAPEEIAEMINEDLDASDLTADQSRIDAAIDQLEAGQGTVHELLEN